MSETPKRCECGNVAQHRVSVGADGWRYLCCACYVQEGNPPADWHTECMTAYRKAHA